MIGALAHLSLRLQETDRQKAAVATVEAQSIGEGEPGADFIDP